jgi:hypothetical protein
LFSFPISELARSARGKREAHAAALLQNFGVVGQDEEHEEQGEKNCSALRMRNVAIRLARFSWGPWEH